MENEVAQGVRPAVGYGELNPRERAVLHAIVDFQTEHGYSPTIRELGPLTGASPSLAALRIAGLCTKGWLRRTRGVARSLVVLRRLPNGRGAE